MISWDADRMIPSALRPFGYCRIVCIGLPPSKKILPRITPDFQPPFGYELFGTERWSCYARRMSTLGLVEYADAGAEVRAVYDDIMATRNTDWINNFWKALAHDPVTLRRTWQSVKEIMAPGALDALTKEMIYVAVSASNQCAYCIASHTAGARKAGMTDQMFAELMAVVGMANETNRLASGYQVEVDQRFRSL
jgi:AhpD family alkylhydroperoxidase